MTDDTARSYEDEVADVLAKVADLLLVTDWKTLDRLRAALNPLPSVLPPDPNNLLREQVIRAYDQKIREELRSAQQFEEARLAYGPVSYTSSSAEFIKYTKHST